MKDRRVKGTVQGASEDAKQDVAEDVLGVAEVSQRKPRKVPLGSIGV